MTAVATSEVEWIDVLPSHWKVLPLRSLAAPGRASFVDGDWIETPFITDEGIRLLQTGNIGTGQFKEQGFRFVSEETFVALRCTEVQPGDILICRLAEPVGRACLAPQLASRMITSVDVCIMKPSPENDARYIVYLLSSPDYLGFMEGQCRGGTRDRVSRSFLGSVRVPVPPPSEQTAIAAFLDHELGKIDALVDGQRRLIDLLKEKRQAVVSNAVTKGLNPNAGMKASGVEWLGDVPEHWEVRRLGTIFSEIAEPGDGNLPIFSVSIHHGVSDKELDDEDLDRKVSRSEDRSKYKRVQPLDLVYNMMRAWQGGFGSVQAVGMVSPAYVVARPKTELSTIYIEALLRTPKAVEEMRRRSRGITDFRLRLYWDEFKDMSVALPPLAEQNEIIRVVAAAQAEVEALMSESGALVDLLQERRAALISAAVTGKIDVREATIDQEDAA